MLDGGKAAVAGNWWREKGRSRKHEIAAYAGLSTLAVSGTMDVGLAAVNKHFNERMNSPAERSKSVGGGLRKS